MRSRVIPVVTIPVFIKAQTADAFKVKPQWRTVDVYEWLPKSLCDSDPPVPFVTAELTMPVWLARSKGLLDGRR